ncbi:response regulator [Metabacillus litoralis]|uniref:Response regulator n=1 Tax=Metabacillus litoralis TaxID=152268 RepID=A0A5C6WAL4_9BACI|nr:response regulator [Metabacillus litoralis]TXC92929.1 response regulator [Metabacillus litoralis]
MINVLIVEDDPMVAEFNKRYLSKIEGFSLVQIANTVGEAITVMQSDSIDLILLDVYMPGQNGLELLSSIREKELSIDVILITAASDVDKIQSALRLGVIDYLIKPFEFERFKQALLRYKEKFDLFHKNDTLNQQMLDNQLLKPQYSTLKEDRSLPKGLTLSTLNVIVDTSKKLISFSTDDVAEYTNISRVSVRKYLLFLSEIGFLRETLMYGIGRPVYHYTYEGNDDVLMEYRNKIK